LGKTGVHSHTIETWYDKGDAEHTWPNFLPHFNKHERTRINKMTAQAAGFHGAQNATRIPPYDQANAAAAQQAGKSKDLFESNAASPCFIVGLTLYPKPRSTPVKSATTKVKAIAPTPPSKIDSEELTKSTSVVLVSSAESQQHRSKESLAKP
jgi:hypothetical protein